MQVEIWSDVVCPWCYIGKRRFESALGSFDRRDEVEVIWRSFELDPSAPRSIEGDMATRLSQKYGMSGDKAKESMAHITSLAAAEGLSYRLGSVKMGNSFDAHRLLQLASLNGMGGKMKERLLRAYFSESQEISNTDVLIGLGVEIGLEEGEISDMYSSDYMSESVRNDEALAARYGISGVPFFVFDSKYGVSGAQPAEVFLDVLQKVEAEANPIKVVGDREAPGCGDDSCAI